MPFSPIMQRAELAEWTAAERRRPGRMVVDLGREPAARLERTIGTYWALLDQVEAVLREADGCPEDRARLEAYRAQFEAQLEHWLEIKRRADQIIRAARVEGMRVD